MDIEPICQHLKNGHICGYKAIYRNYCEMHARYYVDSSTSLISVLQCGSHSLAFTLIKEFGVNPNQKEKGKTPLYVCIKNPHLDEITVRMLIESGADVNAKSIDTVNIEGVLYSNVTISPLFYTLFVSNKSRNVKENILRELYRRNTLPLAVFCSRKTLIIDEHYKGKHLIFHILEQQYDQLAKYALMYIFDDEPSRIETHIDENGNNILHAFVLYISSITKYQRKYIFLENVKTLNIFANEQLLSSKNKKGETPFHLFFRMMEISDNLSVKMYLSAIFGNLLTIFHILDKIDLTITDNEGISILELKKFQEIMSSIRRVNIDIILKELNTPGKKYTKTRGYSHPYMLFIPCQRNIKTYLDILFTLKLVGKRNRRIFCNLVIDRIDYFLRRSYDKKYI